MTGLQGMVNTSCYLILLKLKKVENLNQKKALCLEMRAPRLLYQWDVQFVHVIINCIEW